LFERSNAGERFGVLITRRGDGLVPLLPRARSALNSFMHRCYGRGSAGQGAVLHVWL